MSARYDTTSRDTTSYEAYGLGIDGLPSDIVHLMPEAAPLPHRMTVSFSSTPLPEARFDEASRVMGSGGRAGWVLERASRRATFHGRDVPPDVVAHPFLGGAAVTMNRWLGREAFHAGAVVVAGRARLVIGQREAGKSTLIATLAASGHPILADDIVITDGTSVFAGPRSVDLRAAVPGRELALEPSRWNSRLRHTLAPIASSVPVGRWVFLGWARSIVIERVPVPDLLSLVARARMLPDLASSPSAMLTLGTLPGFAFERPRDWSQLSSSTRALVHTLESAVG